MPGFKYKISGHYNLFPILYTIRRKKMYKSIKPGQIWLDTEGKRIQAHGGSIITVDDTYYWYGENKEKTTGRDDIWHWGVRCYSSKSIRSVSF